MKKYLINTCPACNNKLSIHRGKKDDVYKLMCTNNNCSGTALKKLQKGIVALKIKDIGPKTIEKLIKCGILSSVDLFDPTKMNQENLIRSGEFKKGKTLNNILKNVRDIKEIPISNAILSLQLNDIGKTFSDKIGKKLSGLDVDFSGLLIDVREQLDDKNSDINKQLYRSLRKFEEFGITIIKEKEKVIKKTKSLKKKVYFDESVDQIFITEVINKLDWEISDDPELLISEDKNNISKQTESFKNNGVKLMTIKQIKILFL